MKVGVVEAVDGWSCSAYGLKFQSKNDESIDQWYSDGDAWEYLFLLFCHVAHTLRVQNRSVRLEFLVKINVKAV